MMLPANDPGVQRRTAEGAERPRRSSACNDRLAGVALTIKPSAKEEHKGLAILRCSGNKLFQFLKVVVHESEALVTFSDPDAWVDIQPLHYLRIVASSQSVGAHARERCRNSTYLGWREASWRSISEVLADRLPTNE